MCTGNASADNDIICTHADERLIQNARTTLKDMTLDDTGGCCEKINGMCSGNFSDPVYPCESSRKRLRPDANDLPAPDDTSAIPQRTEEICCEEITGMCSGNTDITEDVDCSTYNDENTYYGRRTDYSTASNSGQATDCCIEVDAPITGMCSGNTEPGDDHECSDGKTFKSLPNTITGNNDSLCCGDCPLGTVGTGGTCGTVCLAGEGQSSDKTTCEPCDVGNYSAAEGDDCTPCSNNSISRTAGATECTPCDPGTQPNSHNTECIVCSSGKYQNGNGHTSCKACPAGTHRSVVTNDDGQAWNGGNSGN